ncbi:hypothetical protein L9F63_021845, partial [Diploptera punctata]
CQEKSTCPADDNIDFSFNRSCQCDKLCSQFGDCCKDSKYYKPSTLLPCVEVGNWNILGTSFVTSYYMINTCPHSWNEDETSYKCKNYLETIKSEPILGHPVTSKATNMTYVKFPLC